MSELPPRVRSTLTALLDAEQQALTIMMSNQRAISETERAHDMNPSGDKAAAQARELARLKALQPEHQEKHRALADLNAKIARYLELLPAHVGLKDAKRIKLKQSGETHLQAVQRLRIEIIGLISEHSRIERASPTTKEMKAMAKRYVRSLAEKHPARLVIDHKRFDLHFGRGMIGEPDPSPLELLSWVDPTLVHNRLCAMIDELPKTSLQMEAADRKQRLDEIKQRLFECERYEIAHIDAARDEGTLIQHRPNVNLQALLGLELVREGMAAA